MGQKRLLLMRGLPSCGKSHTAAILATGGVHLEYDKYFYQNVGTNPKHFSWSRGKTRSADAWFLNEIKNAVNMAVNPIVVDAMNSVRENTWRYIKYALLRDYQVEICEPESHWWYHLRTLLVNRDEKVSELRAWAKKLAMLSQGTQKVPESTFVWHMENWKLDVTIEDYARLDPSYVRNNSIEDVDNQTDIIAQRG